jgi:hypothetical protein
MMDAIKLDIKSQVTASPALLAQMFWAMSSTEQAEFFEALHDLTYKESSYGLGEMQWCYMSDEIEKRPKAKAQACSMMTWIFNRATDFLSRQPDTYYARHIEYDPGESVSMQRQDLKPNEQKE